MVVVKLIPQLLALGGIVLVLLRGVPGRRTVVMTTSICGFVIGVAGVLIMFRSLSGEITIGIIKSALGASFLFLWCISVIAIYRITGRGETNFRGERFVNTSFGAGGFSSLACILAGAVCACRLQETSNNILTLLILVLSAAALAYFLTYVAMFIEKLVPSSFKVSLSSMLAAVVSLLLFSSSSILRLDLFSPLSMKVMKGFHDFVHQFMESILIPDHFFVRPVVWKLIGLLFSKEVGFWGGMAIWFIPVLLIVLAIQYERLPSVAHIRQGAQRRKVLAAAISARRYRLVIPVISVVIFSAAAYQSCFPTVEYWDPKPVPVTASPAGEIFIPNKGEVDLTDGKIHKYIFKQGDREARFFVLLTPEGKFTVDLDACAICKPDGYGQAEGSVICYYCKTLIPLDTVGKPGGCNPVPVPFTEKSDGVAIDGLTLINNWNSTVQATTRIKEGGK